MNRLLSTLAAALMAMVVAAPVAAQGIISNGRVGPQTCAGIGESVDPVVGSIESVTANSANINIDAYTNLYSQLSSRTGDGGPIQFPIHFRARNAKTNAIVFNSNRLIRISSVTANLGRYRNRPMTGLRPRTQYVYEVYTSAGGLGPLLRRCFMTGGTYMPTNTDLTNGSTGCFSIPGLSGQDIRNCLCGRKTKGWFTTGSSDDNNSNNTATSNALGCAD